jgi:hypothetical protein
MMADSRPGAMLPRKFQCMSYLHLPWLASGTTLGNGMAKRDGLLMSSEDQWFAGKQWLCGFHGLKKAPHAPSSKFRDSQPAARKPLNTMMKSARIKPRPIGAKITAKANRFHG